MIMIVVKFPRQARVRRSVARTVARVHRDHPGRAGQQVFDWSRSVENANEYVLIEAFDDDAAGGRT